MQMTAGCAGATSVAVAANVATAPPGPLASSVCDGGWTTTEGGVTSVTTTWKLPVARFCFQSRAEHETVVVPIGNCDPDDGLHVTAAGPETASTADAVNVTTAPALLVEFTRIVSGRVSTGGVASGITLTDSVDDAVPPGAETLIDTSLVTAVDTSLNSQVMLEPDWLNVTCPWSPHDGASNTMPPGA